MTDWQGRETRLDNDKNGKTLRNLMDCVSFSCHYTRQMCDEIRPHRFYRVLEFLNFNIDISRRLLLSWTDTATMALRDL